MRVFSPGFFFIFVVVLSSTLKVVFFYQNGAVLARYHLDGISLTLENFLRYASIPVILLAVAAIALVFIRSLRFRIANMVISVLLAAFSLFITISIKAFDEPIIGSFKHIFTNPYELERGATFEQEMYCCGWDNELEPIVSPCGFEFSCREKIKSVYQDTVPRNFLLSIFALVFDVISIFLSYRLVKELEVFELAEWERLTELVKYKNRDDNDDMHKI